MVRGHEGSRVGAGALLADMLEVLGQRNFVALLGFEESVGKHYFVDVFKFWIRRVFRINVEEYRHVHLVGV